MPRNRENLAYRFPAKDACVPHLPGSTPSLTPVNPQWLHYWSLVLAQAAPPGFWSTPPPAPSPKARIRRIVLRAREPSNLRTSLVRAANAVVGRTGLAKTRTHTGQVWASLARYDDALVRALEQLERETRAAADGARRTVFEDGRWDSQKMVRSFARMGGGPDERRGVVKAETKEVRVFHVFFSSMMRRE
jgi:phosphatidylinositol-3,4,5-trisphosphate 3-phosphatase and dual-specificity protein phosphatase PTEN